MRKTSMMIDEKSNIYCRDRAISHTWELSLLERENQLNKPLYSMHLLTNRFFVKMLKKYS